MERKRRLRESKEVWQEGDQFQGRFFLVRSRRGRATFVTLNSGRGKRRLERLGRRSFLKGVFGNKGCWGLPQQLQATVGCL